MDIRVPTDPSKAIQVIGAGFPRTGTVSFSLALEILLGGPTCHSGSASFIREGRIMKTWVAILQANHNDEKEASDVEWMLEDLLVGFTAVTDAPACMFAGELARIYPEAKVICTVREANSWFRSLEEVREGAEWFAFCIPLFWPMSAMRWFRTWLHAVYARCKYIYGNDVVLNPEFLEVHRRYLQRVVPKERLFFVDVKDGWEPLCAILNLPVPSVPFPYTNKLEENKSFMNRLMRKAVIRWLQIFVVLGFSVMLVIHLWRTMERYRNDDLSG